MSWLSDFQDATVVRTRTARTLSVQIGLANPLWLAFGAAAGAGAAWWLMAKSWQPVNLEAQAAAVPPAPEPVAVIAVDAAPMIEAEALVEAEPALAVAPEAAVEPVVETVIEAEETVVAETLAAADDLTRLIGVGPKTAAALAAKGVATFADLAAWTAEDLAAFDDEMKLKGRSLREAWLDQARALAAG